MGVQLEESRLFTLYFADDQVVLAEDREDLSYMVRKLKEEYELNGLVLNVGKCEYLVVGSDIVENLPLEDGEVKGVRRAKYLGVIFDKSGSSGVEVEERIQKGRKVTRAFNSVWWDRGVSKKTKKRIYKSMVQSVVLYGSEVWELKQRNTGKLLATEMDVLRRSCRKRRLDRVRNEDIRR
ncbi:uncharacterized protein LOC128982603 [Macrosteles quadrilineatus]|uniref:uncharacterized protein LOC128982603 n=1 Tax=Macrosteles quadrilineatus TaxID=74068 RepID=UPI0023E0F456|nr:uncharacterized protein LOC128982603 [Macrosteles quadrilineatus]